jgi:hypothetical protein
VVLVEKVLFPPNCIGIFPDLKTDFVKFFVPPVIFPASGPGFTSVCA